MVGWVYVTARGKKHTHKEDDIHTHKWGITIIQISHNTEQPAGHIGKILWMTDDLPTATDRTYKCIWELRMAKSTNKKHAFFHKQIRLFSVYLETCFFFFNFRATTMAQLHTEGNFPKWTSAPSTRKHSFWKPSKQWQSPPTLHSMLSKY
jgi:hypothetical protein